MTTERQAVEPSPLATSSPRVHGRDARSTADHGPAPERGGLRRSGVLVHVTSLVGPDGIGDLGAPSRSFVEWLARAGQAVWQVLPLHPPSNAAMSPYDASSAFAGNPLLISLDDLVAIGLLPDTVDAMRASVGAVGSVTTQGAMVAGRSGGVDPLARAARWKLPLVRQAARQLLSLPPAHELVRDYLGFCERQGWWLADYVAFTALREQYPGVARSDWPIEDRVRHLGAHRARSLDIGATHQHPEAAVQFLFHQQLQRLHAHAAQLGVSIMGDVPIYVGDDSADVWAHPELFLLDGEHRPKVRTGAPPDAMDPRGQIWPMPAYDWAASAASGHEWWIRRLQHVLSAADLLRLDHFRGFGDWWSVPRTAAFAEQGRWEPGPGASFFDAARPHLGDAQLVVEDLGAETDALRQLREQTGLPQMRVLVEGLEEGGASRHLPTAWTGEEAAYTATHDYDTVRGWTEHALQCATDDPTDQRLAFALRFTGAGEPSELPRAAIETVQRSNARLVIVPMQDWLGLGSDARTNVPGTAVGNWRWVMPAGTLTESLAEELAATAARTGRVP